MTTPKVLNLNIAELIVTDEFATINTTLGSCVSVCLFSLDKKIAGMIHYALPYMLETSRGNDELRYGEHAIPLLISKVEKETGVSAKYLKAKVVGGANCFIRTSKGGLDNIGQQNVEIAMEILVKHGIEIVGEHTGGEFGRRVIFHSYDGRLQVAMLSKAS